MTIKAILFDRDNTLLYFDPVQVGLLDRIIGQATALPVGSVIRHWQAWNGPWPRTEDEEPGFWTAFWETFVAQHQLSKSLLPMLETTGFGTAYHEVFIAYPETAQCLQALRTAGYRLGVLTNFELPSIAKSLSHVGIDPTWFDVLLSSAAIGFRKPDPQAYLAAATALGVTAEECVFVDDEAANVAAANGVGMQGIRIDRSPDRSGGGAYVKDLEELVDRIHNALLPDAIYLSGG